MTREPGWLKKTWAGVRPPSGSSFDSRVKRDEDDAAERRKQAKVDDHLVKLRAGRRPSP